VIGLLAELVDGEAAPYLAESLLATLDPDLVLYQRQARGLAVEQLKDGWARLVAAL
jgi:hypothetical protein